MVNPAPCPLPLKQRFRGQQPQLAAGRCVPGTAAAGRAVSVPLYFRSHSFRDEGLTPRKTVLEQICVFQRSPTVPCLLEVWGLSCQWQGNTSMRASESCTRSESHMVTQRCGQRRITVYIADIPVLRKTLSATLISTLGLPEHLPV